MTNWRFICWIRPCFPPQQKLRVVIDQLVPIIDESRSGTKILIFTEYRASQAYLERALRHYFGDRYTELIHGGNRTTNVAPQLCASRAKHSFCSRRKPAAKVSTFSGDVT